MQGRTLATTGSMFTPHERILLENVGQNHGNQHFGWCKAELFFSSFTIFAYPKKIKINWKKKENLVHHWGGGNIANSLYRAVACTTLYYKLLYSLRLVAAIGYWWSRLEKASVRQSNCGIWMSVVSACTAGISMFFGKTGTLSKKKNEMSGQRGRNRIIWE